MVLSVRASAAPECADMRIVKLNYVAPFTQSLKMQTSRHMD